MHSKIKSVGLWLKSHKIVTAFLTIVLILFCLFTILSSQDNSVRPYADMSMVGRTSGPTVLRDVVVVGNNWDGTADVFNPNTFELLKRFDIVPDFDERMEEVNSSRVRRFFFRIIHLFYA